MSERTIRNSRAEGQHSVPSMLGFLMVCVVLLNIATASVVVAETNDGQGEPVLRIAAPRSSFDLSHDYYTQLLAKALKAGADGRPVPALKTVLNAEQGRALTELNKGAIDVFWVGTDSQKESQFLPVRIPLERGLMGFRRFIIHQDNYAQLQRLETTEQLQTLVACQGTHWPDTRILGAAGLSVLASPVYENLFRQVKLKRCDYFPRGFHEGPAEIKRRRSQYPELLIYPSLVMHYPFGVYFFTTKDKTELSNWLTLGLERLIDGGELLQHMQQHPLTSHVFPLSQWRISQWISLANEEMSPLNPVNNPRYWVQKSEFGNAAAEPELN